MYENGGQCVEFIGRDNISNIRDDNSLVDNIRNYVPVSVPSPVSVISKSTEDNWGDTGQCGHL